MQYGQVLCHDITQIIPGVVKDAVFRKGHLRDERGYSRVVICRKGTPLRVGEEGGNPA